MRDLTLALRGIGLGKGRFGLIMARNVPEHLVADLAIVHAAGAAISRTPVISSSTPRLKRDS